MVIYFAVFAIIHSLATLLELTARSIAGEPGLSLTSVGALSAFESAFGGDGLSFNLNPFGGGPTIISSVRNIFSALHDFFGFKGYAVAFSGGFGVIHTVIAVFGYIIIVNHLLRAMSGAIGGIGGAIGSFFR